MYEHYREEIRPSTKTENGEQLERHTALSSIYFNAIYICRDISKIGRLLAAVWPAGKQLEQQASQHETGQQSGDKEPQPKRGRGRPKTSFAELMCDDEDGQKLKRLHSLMDGKKGKAAAGILLSAMLKGYIIGKPTHHQIEEEFGQVMSKQLWSKYGDVRMFDKIELDGIAAIL